ncbi:MAG: ATP-grasp domain-containing protein [Halobacteriovoraceae bacterium]|nr:ATP-grasp domain-containing protein [Halobacteriovoraceae bacterium]
MKKRILIANRGEIAKRIARAVRELGHIAIGVWTDAEPHALHLEYCHEWIKLVGKSRQETYLNIDQWVDIITKYEIDCVHPGYGFLSENADFARAVINTGTIYIGPNADAVELMGNKALAKMKAKEAGVPTLPGTKEPVKDLEEAVVSAKEIGYPVIMKAIAGGGGRGMRICYNEQDVRNQYDRATTEAEAAFKNGALILERYVVNPRHIEVQIMSDGRGRHFHFFERECTVQRRHQKVLEEAPSPFIGSDEELRNRICNTAVDLARSVNYDSAGTVEFIVDENKDFFFLEMNTRIQVEHPITEEITGIDLIVCMIQIALGEDLGINNQSEITRSGHAIECRIFAEDPLTLMPAPGKVTGFDAVFPQGVRFDNSLFRGLNITPDFDPMVGKLIAKGINRKVAIRKMRSALQGLILNGLKTNLPLHKAMLENNVFLEGTYANDFLDTQNVQESIDTDINLHKIFKEIASFEARKLGI